MIADLHTHSTASDGTLAPTELLQQAIDSGVELLAVTDHDTVAGTESLAAEQLPNIRLITGVELSANWRNVCVHVVGLNIDTVNPALKQGLLRQQATRAERAVKIATRLESAGFHDVLSGAKQLTTSSYIGRPHFARYLVESGQIKDVKTAFKKHLGRGKAGDIRHGWPAIEEIIDWIKAAGGIAVLAHPAKYKLSNLRLEELCREFVSVGGDAIEVISGAQVPALTDRLSRLANRHGLHASCGSDFHEPGQIWARLGQVSPLPAACRPVWELW